MLADFFVPFFAVGLAEIGDKTQLALIFLSCADQRRSNIFVGAVAGFALSNAVAVAAGSWVGESLPKDTIKFASAAMFIVLGAFMLKGKVDNLEEVGQGRNPLLYAFTLTAVMELGDKTQITSAVFAATYEPVPVFLGALGALSILSAAAIAFGAKISERLDTQTTKKAAGIFFLLAGASLILIE